MLMSCHIKSNCGCAILLKLFPFHTKEKGVNTHFLTNLIYYRKQLLYNPVCLPGLLDRLNPFIALALLLCSQLQRFLSIMTKHDEEVVLQRKRENWFRFCDPEKKTDSPSPAVSLYSTMLFWLPIWDATVTANQTYATDIWKRCFSCPVIHPAKSSTGLIWTEQSSTQTEWETGWGRVGGSTHMTELFAHWNKTSNLVCVSLLHQPIIITIN